MARDAHHDAVRRALEKEGWTITDDPFLISVGRGNLQIDLGAERLMAAERQSERIAVEIKVFGAVSLVNAFHLALGQILNYRINLEDLEPERKLFLAVPESVFDSFFQTELVQKAISRLHVAVLVFDPEAEVIVKWS